MGDHEKAADEAVDRLFHQRHHEKEDSNHPRMDEDERYETSRPSRHRSSELSYSQPQPNTNHRLEQMRRALHHREHFLPTTTMSQYPPNYYENISVSPVGYLPPRGYPSLDEPQTIMTPVGPMPYPVCVSNHSLYCSSLIFLVFYVSRTIRFPQQHILCGRV